MRRVVVGLVAAALLVACGGDDSPAVETQPPPEDTSVMPTVTIPDTEPPSALAAEDLVVGTGAEATSGDTVTVQYVGVSWSTKEQFDASWDRGRPFAFRLGQGQVIQGWEQGVVGMRVGGRRQLIIPPDLGYGERGAGASIAPNETLVFVIDLLEVS